MWKPGDDTVVVEGYPSTTVVAATSNSRVVEEWSRSLYIPLRKYVVKSYRVNSSSLLPLRCGRLPVRVVELLWQGGKRCRALTISPAGRSS